MMISNAWASFMVSPAGIDESGHYLGNLWQAIHTALWNPTNVHRFASHLVLAASVIAAYSAYQAWTTNDLEEKARYDWISSHSFLVMIFALFTIPFGAYWLQREIYAYSQQMGITLLGGLLAWLGLIRVVIVGGLFFGINYYLWQRIDGAVPGKRYNHYAKYVFLILSLCFVVYITPHTMIMTPLELKQMGGQQHQVLGNYGVESAKNAAVNIMIIVTMWSLILWRKSLIQMANQTFDWPLAICFLVGATNIIWLGIYGYYIPANVRIGLSIPMLTTTLTLVVLGLLFTRGTNFEEKNGSAGWGRVSTRGYFALFFSAFAVTWIIGLGGYLRSSIRLFWHVNEIIRDQSPWAFTHSSGFAANVITLNALIFWTSLLFLFWLAQLGQHKVPALSQSNTQDLLPEKQPV